MRTLAACFALFAALCFSCPQFCDAARLGGGESFGSKPYMSEPAKPSESRSYSSSRPSRSDSCTIRHEYPGRMPPRADTEITVGALGMAAGLFLGSLLSGHSAIGNTIGILLLCGII